MLGVSFGTYVPGMLILKKFLDIVDRCGNGQIFGRTPWLERYCIAISPLP